MALLTACFVEASKRDRKGVREVTLRTPCRCPCPRLTVPCNSSCCGAEDDRAQLRQVRLRCGFDLHFPPQPVPTRDHTRTKTPPSDQEEETTGYWKQPQLGSTLAKSQDLCMHKKRQLCPAPSPAHTHAHAYTHGALSSPPAVPP